MVLKIDPNLKARGASYWFLSQSKTTFITLSYNIFSKIEDVLFAM